MSRSQRQSPVCGITTCDSEKHDKRIANRILRSMGNDAIRTCRDFDELVMPIMREAVNVWGMGKDGKRRINPAKNPELMRK